MTVNLKSLIGKLNETTRNALEGAAGLCLSRTHYDIEIEHFLLKLLDAQDSDLMRIIQHFGVDKSRFTGELTRGLDKLKTGNARNPVLSPSLVKMLTTGWTVGSVDYNAGQIRSGFAIVALLTEEELVRIARDFSREFFDAPFRHSICIASTQRLNTARQALHSPMCVRVLPVAVLFEVGHIPTFVLL